MLKTVVVSDRLRRLGVKENHRGFPTKREMRVFGADTETVKGKLWTFQAASEGESTLEYATPKNGFKHLMRWLLPRCRANGNNLCFFHNLRYDLSVLFEENHESLYDQYNDIRLEKDGFIVSMLFGRVNFARIWEDLGGYVCKSCGEIPGRATVDRDGQKFCGNPRCGLHVRRNLGTRIQFIDSAAFCPPGSKSLGAALKIYGVDAEKLPLPKGLGERYLKTREFERYALNDAVVEEKLGRAILEVHREYDITPSISLPQLSGRILRHHFFKAGESFPFPPEACRLASEYSYHAGKNGMYAARGVYENVFEYDINSAFPEAMKALPQLVKGNYNHVQKFNSRALGVYCIRGSVPTTRVPVLFDSEFRPVRGRFGRTWVTGFEYALLRKLKKAKFRMLEGWVWKDKKKYTHSPLGEFVDKFWTLKNTAPKGPARDTYKNILNSLYGKFAACVEKRPTIETALGPVQINDGEAPGKYFVAGALYHPFLASQITGYVRAKLYGLEIQGEALHAATDSIKSFKELPTSDVLGGLKKEVYGRCYLFRNKLYLHFAKDNSLCQHNLEKGWLYVSEDDRGRLHEVGDKRETGFSLDKDEGKALGKIFDPDGQHLCKYGLHGFKGSVFYLYRERNRLLKNGELNYSYQHMVNLREGWKRGEIINAMTTRREKLTLPALCASTATE